MTGARGYWCGRGAVGSRCRAPGAGHEGLAALAPLLRADDYLFPHYRDRALMLARGASTFEIALGFFGRAASSSGGRQMASHWSSRAHNVVSLASPVGLQCLPSAGAAWSCALNGSGQVALCLVGEATVRQGEFYEALCFALQEKLPLVFVVEDNGYGISTPTNRFNPFTLGALGEGVLVCGAGRDVTAVAQLGGAAIEAARQGAGPTVLWLEMDRLFSHTSSDDHRLYRSPADIAAMQARDPLLQLRDALLEAGELAPEEWEAELAAIAEEVDEDYERAEAAPAPTEAQTHVFAAAPFTPQRPQLPPRDTWTMLESLNHTLRAALEEDPRVLLFGEDIEDPKGGVFGLTKGLSSAFAGRVRNSPLAARRSNHCRGCGGRGAGGLEAGVRASVH